MPRKDTATYHRIFERHAIEPSRALMVGNSMPSDILPVLELGGHAAHVPYAILWAHEAHDADPVSERFYRLESLRDLKPLLGRLHNGHS